MARWTSPGCSPAPSRTCLTGIFSSDAMRGVLSVSGVIGTWAGPRSAGTAYAMLHHHIGDTTWGFPRGGMGAVTSALRLSAETFGVSIRTGSEVARIRTAGDRVPRGDPRLRRGA